MIGSKSIFKSPEAARLSDWIKLLGNSTNQNTDAPGSPSNSAAAGLLPGPERSPVSQVRVSFSSRGDEICNWDCQCS